MKSKAANQTGWKSRIVGSGVEDPEQLVANPRNWRRHPGPQREAIRGALSEIGWVQQVIVNRTTGNLVDGHARVEEALSTGQREVPVVYVELSHEEEGVVLATLDPIGAMASVAGDRLAELLAEISIDDAGLADVVTRMAAKVGIEDGVDLAPDLFSDPESGLSTGYRCPRCSHEWSGSPKP